MQVRFWGTRGSIAKAGPTTVRYGGNTSCVELRSDSGTVVALDCGTGAHGLGHALVREPAAMRRGHVLISHTHWDHIQGLPFFAPLFVPGNEWHVYGPQGLGPSLAKVLSGQMEYTYFPITTAEFRAHIDYHDLVEGSFTIGDIHVTTHYLNHPALTLAYRLEADGVCVVYATDHEPHLRRLADGGVPPPGGEDERHGQFLADADLVIHDTQYTAAEYPRFCGWGHSTMEYVVDLACAGAVRRLAMFHHDPLRHDDALDELALRAGQRVHDRGDPMEVFAAAEGRLIAIPRRRSAVAPLRPIRAKDSSSESSEVSALARPVSELAGATVVIASDDAATVEVLRAAAAADGLQVITASDGEAALRIVREARPILVLASAGLPGGGGVGLCRAVRAVEGVDGELPIVLIAAAESVDVALGADAGASDWLPAPFSSVYARTRIRAWCLRRPCRWRPAPLPADEPRRLRALASLALREGVPEDRFDAITRIAAALFGVALASINLVDAARQWSKSSAPCPLAEGPRDMSLCAFTILGDDIFQVSDSLRSEHADNLMMGEMRLRFYAGVPLAAPDGSRVGTLCLADERPRDLDAAQRVLLKDLGRMVERELAAVVTG